MKLACRVLSEVVVGWGRNSCQAFVCCDGVIAVHHLHAIKEFLHFFFLSLTLSWCPHHYQPWSGVQVGKASLLYSCCCFSSGLLERFLTLLSVASSLPVWVSTPSSLVCYPFELKNTLVGLLLLLPRSLLGGEGKGDLSVAPFFRV